MGGPSPIEAFAPLANPLAERVAALAARIGRETADCAILMFALPMPADVRERFETETLVAIGELLDEFGQVTPGDKERFRQIASLALDRRLAHHAMQGIAGGVA
ncbi:hypothetical protein [Aureimonas leprariae]|uniref:Uncharacterized protein n=1 Tax=Plantimonas leprariae TaxID=2615207 RepID=A0A7V7PQ51_9HYPH|nr:hypothetical protein [Aureimonas leprariae]KAB0680179.1 hypothetical protein F6X38_08290 [Aureimonas leprariae]